MRHRYEYSTWGVEPGSGRPHGVIQEWRCTRCGAAKVRAPENGARGQRVIRWRYKDRDGYSSATMPRCSWI